MAFVIIVFAGMALSDKMGGQIAVDLFERTYSEKLNQLINILVSFMGCIIFLALAWAVYDSSRISIMLNLQTNLLGLQKFWFQWALSVFALLTAVGHFLRAITLTRL
jgi:TRAP-type C4-dicarboxylate transport system permease small subunit